MLPGGASTLRARLPSAALALASARAGGVPRPPRHRSRSSRGRGRGQPAGASGMADVLTCQPADATKGFEPAPVWTIFEQLTRIPRPSKHEEQVLGGFPTRVPERDPPRRLGD